MYTTNQATNGKTALPKHNHSLVSVLRLPGQRHQRLPHQIVLLVAARQLDALGERKVAEEGTCVRRGVLMDRLAAVLATPQRGSTTAASLQLFPQPAAPVPDNATLCPHLV
jgi:hypothetical protein